MDRRAMARTYRVRFELDETGWYTITVPDVQGCLSQARDVPDGLDRIREALSLFVDDADDAELLAEVVGHSAPRRAAAG